MIVLHLSQKKDRTGPITVCLSPLTTELIYRFFFRYRLFALLFINHSKSKSVCVGIFLSPCRQHSFSRSENLPFFCLCYQIMVLILVSSYSCLACFPSFKKGVFAKIIFQRIQKCVLFLHKSADTTERSRM